MSESISLVRNLLRPTVAVRDTLLGLMIVFVAPGWAQELKRFPASGTSGLARAVQVADVPLAHTAMMLGWDKIGKVGGDAKEQARQALANLDLALDAAGSQLNRVVNSISISRMIPTLPP